MSGTKVKNFLLNLYPELARFRRFNQITAIVIPTLTPRLKKVMRWGLPLVTVLFVILLGTVIGSWLLGLFFPKQVTPLPIEFIAPTTTPGYQSPFLPLKRSIEEFNPALPDPLPPVFDDRISLEPLSE